MQEFSVSVSLLCPICGSDQFKCDEEAEGSIICADCGYESFRDELVSDNSEQIDAEELCGEVKEQLEEKMLKSLQQLFKGSTSIKVKRGH
ncbi:hypothetical protein ACFSJ3_15690 [Corallincola platygyrae]|uniref:Uncharacterized protein n=1 Tax=Corallincola platygyrae TaxID=1193278 RepID=A0ABW4XPE0_9GAMM